MAKHSSTLTSLIANPAILRGLIIVSVSIAIFIGLIGLSNFATWDLEGRLSEIQTAPPLLKSDKEPIDQDKEPIMRLTLHREMSDENAVEMSASLFIPEGLVKELQQENFSSISGEVRDETGISSFFIPNSVKVDVNSLRPGETAIANETPRFQMPFFPSVAMFPFDRTILYVSAEVYQPNRFFLRNGIEVVKMIPGRVMLLSAENGNLKIELVRTPLEKIFVILCAFVFVLLSGVIVTSIFKSKENLSGVDGIVAIAGFILASSGFRDLLEVPKETGTTFLEIATFGVPFVFLIAAILFSLNRRYFGAIEDGGRTG